MAGWFKDVAAALSKVGPLDFSGIGKAMSLNSENMNKIGRNIGASHLDQQRQALKQSMEKMKPGSDDLKKASEQLNKINKQEKMLEQAMASGNFDNISAAVTDITGKEKLGYGEFAKGYFGDKEFGTTRKVVAGSAIGGVAIGGRMLSGGNLTTNAQGEHDIVGIPFV